MAQIPSRQNFTNACAGEANWSLKRISTLAIGVLAAIGGCAGSSVEHANVAYDVSPDGKQVVLSSSAGGLFLFDLTTKTTRQLSTLEFDASTPSFSPDGKSVVFASIAKDTSSRIESISIDSGKHVQLTNEKRVSDRLPTFSSDGKRIAFARAVTNREYSMGGRTWDSWDVYIMDADGSNLTQLTKEHYYGIDGLTFSPDGKSIYYSAEGNRAAAELAATVFNVGVDGNAQPRREIPGGTTAQGAWAAQPVFSPDGKSMAVISDRTTPYKYDVMLVDVAASHATPLGITKIAAYNQQPKFRSDREIMFLAGERSNSESRPIFSLWSVRIDGTNATRIADSTLFTDPLHFKTQSSAQDSK